MKWEVRGTLNDEPFCQVIPATTEASARNKARERGIVVAAVRCLSSPVIADAASVSPAIQFQAEHETLKNTIAQTKQTAGYFILLGIAAALFGRLFLPSFNLIFYIVLFVYPAPSIAAWIVTIWIRSAKPWAVTTAIVMINIPAAAMAFGVIRSIHQPNIGTFIGAVLIGKAAFCTVRLAQSYGAIRRMAEYKASGFEPIMPASPSAVSMATNDPGQPN